MAENDQGKWTTEETFNLLRAIQETNTIAMLDQKRQRNQAIFLKVAERVVGKTWEQCRTKWKNLKQKYHTELRQTNLSGIFVVVYLLCIICL